MDYQRKLLADMSNIGAAGPLPPEIANLADESLADMSWSDPSLGFSNSGFFPVIRTISALAFIQRIPMTARVAIMQAAGAPDYNMQALLQMIGAASNGINLDDSDLIAGIAYAVAHSLLTADQATALRA